MLLSDFTDKVVTKDVTYEFKRHCQRVRVITGHMLRDHEGLNEKLNPRQLKNYSACNGKLNTESSIIEHRKQFIAV